MRGHSLLLAFASTLLCLTTADPIALAIVMPTESATPPLDRLTNSGPLDQQRSGVRATRQVISEGMGKETCGFFRTGGELALVTCTAGTGTSRIACHNTGRWLCGSLYSTCLGPAEPICSGKTQNGERTLCCNTESPVCGTLLRGSGESQRTGLACFGADFKTRSIQTLASNTWPTFITDPLPPSSSTSSASSPSATSRPQIASAKPCATPTTATPSASPTSRPIKTSTFGIPDPSPSPAMALEQSASVGNGQSGIVRGLGVLAFAMHVAWIGL
ncbi:hypothetical protein CTAM01_05661 [Colletotrichum tamarilloi]|uniref:Cyanovirin-N domain-containing protein n=1 Tax=Colletotrichum tamarilloi TaxID=1209934 RepID=A0ABQ9REX8_9PEZI|nr:uncharacterized protein CTAM01_05661 [Colletotrichum tamarilloi]KAK1502223.1 hypothetical protein CTAM01_05661 [Colletotrichum tamarilloi]